MRHTKADLFNIELIDCLYHRTYMTSEPTLVVSIDGEMMQYKVRRRAAKRDALYHKKGLKCCLVVYNGYVLAYEIIKFGGSASERNISILKALIENGDVSKDDWYFDSEKFYKLDAAVSDQFLDYTPISVIDPIHFTYESSIEVIENDCFIISQNGNILIQSPPIQGSLEVRNKKFLITDNEQDIYYLNLSALLKMCNVVSKLYGSDEIEKFDLPQYMLRHKTVNIAKLPPYVKDNSTTALSPSDAISYLMGLMNKESKLSNIVKLVKLIKMIIRGGIFNSTLSEENNVYKDKQINIIKLDL